MWTHIDTTVFVDGSGNNRFLFDEGVPMQTISFGVLSGIMITLCCSITHPLNTTSLNGANHSGHQFFQALVCDDYEQAYLHLDPTSQSKITRVEFEKSARSYRDAVRFPFQIERIRDADHQPEMAIIRVPIALKMNNGEILERQDAFYLRKHEDQWRIVLPYSFSSIKNTKRLCQLKK